MSADASCVSDAPPTKFGGFIAWCACPASGGASPPHPPAPCGGDPRAPGATLFHQIDFAAVIEQDPFTLKFIPATPGDGGSSGHSNKNK